MLKVAKAVLVGADSRGEIHRAGMAPGRPEEHEELVLRVEQLDVGERGVDDVENTARIHIDELRSHEIPHDIAGFAESGEKFACPGELHDGGASHCGIRLPR